MVLVDPDYRNRGIGTILLERTIEYLDSAGIPSLKLDATPAGKPLYEKLGFTAEYEIDRWILKRDSEQRTENAIPLSSEELSNVFQRDREVFGADRTALLRSLNEQAPNLTLMSRSGIDPEGYAFGRRGLFADHLGPWMAREAETAKNLLAEFLQRSTRETIIVDALKSNPIAGKLLPEYGFSPVRLLTRRYRGSNSFPGDPASLCSIAGPEFG
jgi:predicted acetyltransferase